MCLKCYTLFFLTMSLSLNPTLFLINYIDAPLFYSSKIDHLMVRIFSINLRYRAI